MYRSTTPQFTLTEPALQIPNILPEDDLDITLDNIFLFMRGARARWKIENETFITLKNQGYHFGHNYGLGKQHLTEMFIFLMMLAFLTDQIQQLCCPPVQWSLEEIEE